MKRSALIGTHSLADAPSPEDGLWVVKALLGCPAASTGPAKAKNEAFEQYKMGRGAELPTFPRSRRISRKAYAVLHNRVIRWPVAVMQYCICGTA